MKTCRTCGINKELSDYCKVTKNKDGYNNFCRECQNKKDKLYRENNKEKISNRLKNYNEKEEIKEQRSKYAKEFRLKNLELMRKKAIEKQKAKRKDPMYKFKEAIRNRIRNSINHNGARKNSKTAQILGCSFDEFRNHIESKFEPWMNWNNRGLYNGELNYGWDLDHIEPISSATSECDIIKLNHYTNYQPLCSKINRDIKRNN
jgi:hypothetical protein